jgi:hypothetical protein
MAKEIIFGLTKYLCSYFEGIFNMPSNVQSCLLGYGMMMKAVRTSETSVYNYFTRQYIPEDNSEHHTRRRENLKSHAVKSYYVGPTSLLLFRRKDCCRFLSPLVGIVPANLGLNGKHANH